MAGVLLVSMPYAPLFKPSIGLGLLQGALRRRGIACASTYPCIDFAARTGVGSYLRLSECFPDVAELAGEWVFREALHGEDGARDADYLEAIVRKRGAARDRAFAAEFPGKADPREAFVRTLRAARGAVAGFMDEWAGRIAARAPAIVGFTSVFQQHVAVAAMARRVREKLPSAFIVVGGANVEGCMGAQSLAAFPWIDAVVSGEGDLAFPEMVERVLAGRGAEGIAGVLTRRAARAGLGPVASSPVEDLDALPDPEYGDYFDELAQAAPRLDDLRVPHLPFETSRGCWWGEVSHCTFCGLNGETMRFRSKGATRALDELERLVTRHRGHPVAVVDNIIDNRYFRDFVPMLAERRLGLSLFYEVKANLRREQVRALRAAGIRTIQPGIESLDSDVLALMGKGITAIQNVRLLKLCREEGVDPRWNLLWGFPGEPAGVFDRMARLAPRLAHLPPPVGGSPIRLDRFSPNFDQRDARGFANVRPAAAYGSIHPWPQEALARIACFFDFDYAQPREIEAEAAPLDRAILEWQREHPAASLFATQAGGVLLVWDLRPGAPTPLHAFAGVEREILMACADIATEHALVGEGPGAEARRRALARLESLGLVLREGRSWLALPLALGAWSPEGAALARFVAAAGAAGRADAGDVLIAVPGIEAAAEGSVGTPHSLRLSPGHFAWEAPGLLRVRLRALRAAALNRMGLAFSGLPTAEGAWR